MPIFNPFIAFMIHRSGRSWWQARYSDGRVLSEWDTIVIAGGKAVEPYPGASSRWEEVPKDHMIGLRLLCPNGRAGELMAPEGHKFFQLKSGGFDVGTGGAQGGHYQDAHVIGVVKDSDGKCLCKAWEVKAKRLITFEDNVNHMNYLHIGRLSFEVQGLRV